MTVLKMRQSHILGVRLVSLMHSTILQIETEIRDIVVVILFPHVWQWRRFVKVV